MVENKQVSGNQAFSILKTSIDCPGSATCPDGCYIWSNAELDFLAAAGAKAGAVAPNMVVGALVVSQER